MERKHKIMTVQEVANYLRVHSMTVYRMTHRGDLPAFRIGKSWRFQKELIDQRLLNHQRNGTTALTPVPNSGHRGRSQQTST